MSELLGLDANAMQAAGLTKLGLRLLLDLFFTALVVFCVYARKYGHNQFVFTYVLFNVITFTLCFLLRKVPIELGFALGLFAVFGILRYRTEAIRTRDLTYLFIVIGLAIVNAVANAKVSLAELLVVNTTIAGLTAICEYSPRAQRFISQQIPSQKVDVVYDNMEILRSGDREALIRDLSERTGLDVQGVSVRQVDLLRDTARLSASCPRQDDTDSPAGEV